MRKYQIIIYGSYGYTGRLIAEECKTKNLSVLLSGRNEEKLVQQSEEAGYPYEALEIQNQTALIHLLEQGDLVIHCGGPFIHTARQMADACIAARTHYTDITGEYEVFELLAGYDERAKSAGITIIPGVGFDVIPSDCLALHLKNLLPDATHLEMAFAMTKAGMSRGTNKTMTENMGYGSVVRKNGELVSVPLGKDVKEIDFGSFSMKGICIPWGDISTAWRSTSIQNIKVYMGVPDKMIKNAKMSNWLGWLLRKRWIKNYLLKKIDQKPAGPSKEAREKGRSYLWGKVWNQQGAEVEARLEVPNGYLLTAKSSVLIAEKLLKGEVRPGSFTPAQYFGEGLILEVGDSRYL